MHSSEDEQDPLSGKFQEKDNTYQEVAILNIVKYKNNKLKQYETKYKLKLNTMTLKYNEILQLWEVVP